MNTIPKNPIEEAIEVLAMLQEDNSISKNMRVKFNSLVQTLQTSDDVQLNVTKVLEELDDLSQNINIQPFIRTQIWNLTSILESLNSRV
ncbi:MAG: UPF0147 family protein [Candidatus Woesearchaeota archaeon]